MNLPSTDDILSRAQGLLGPVPESRLGALTQFCAAALASYALRLGRELPDEALEALGSAAAVSAAAAYLELDSALLGGGSVRVGDVTVSARQSDGVADSLRSLADALLAPWLPADDFHFRGVPS